MAAKASSRRPGLRMLLLLANLVILTFPLSGLYFFRVYQIELVRQTESELIVQAALVAAVFRSELVSIGGPDYGLTHWSRPLDEPQSLNIIAPKLGRSSPVDPSPQSLSASAHAPDPVAMKAAAALGQIIEEATSTTLSTITLLDFRGLLVSEGPGRGLSLARNEEVAEALAGNYHSLLRAREVSKPSSLSSPSRDTPYRVFAALPVFNGQRLAGVVCLSRTPRELPQALYQERRSLILAGALTLLLMILATSATSILIVGPIGRLAAEAAEAAEDPSKPPKPKSPWDWVSVREIADLRASVVNLNERLGRRSDYLKAFAGGVSHEFKTPLAAIKGAMELIGEHGRDMDPEVFQRFAGNISLDLDRLERLVSRLLALAKAEAISPTRQERTRLLAHIESMAARYLEAHPGFGVMVRPAPEELELAMAPEVLETALLNLWDNSRESGATEAAVELEKEGDAAKIIVSDNGPGLSDEAKEKIFTPFFTTRSSSGGTGLGLSLAKTLLAPYHGSLDYAGPPAVFVIRAPLAPPAKP
jgi:signal transduction histidine kinase